MAESPTDVLQSIVNASAELTGAHTAGISILEESDEGKRFRWHAVMGRWEKYLGGSMPREASPCGTDSGPKRSHADVEAAPSLRSDAYCRSTD
jgi:hypothetical protein